MFEILSDSLIALLVYTLIWLVVLARILLRANRAPASRIAWVVVVGSVPLLGMLSYLLFGEVNIGRRRVAEMRKALARLPPPDSPSFRHTESVEVPIPKRYRSLFSLGYSISGFRAVGGNTACLLFDSNTTIDSMVADIDAACDHVHLLFYIGYPTPTAARSSRR